MVVNIMTSSGASRVALFHISPPSRSCRCRLLIRPLLQENQIRRVRPKSSECTSPSYFQRVLARPGLAEAGSRAFSTGLQAESRICSRLGFFRWSRDQRSRLCVRESTLWLAMVSKAGEDWRRSAIRDRVAKPCVCVPRFSPRRSVLDNRTPVG